MGALDRCAGHPERSHGALAEFVDAGGDLVGVGGVVVGAVGGVGDALELLSCFVADGVADGVDLEVDAVADELFDDGAGVVGRRILRRRTRG